MTKEVYQKWASLRPYAFFLAVFLATACFISGAITVHADPITDTAPPVLSPNVKEGEYRNTVTFTLGVADEHPERVSIEVLASDDQSLTPRVLAEDTEGGSNLLLTWDTAGIEKGDYRVRYVATDTLGQRSEELYSFKVANYKPLVMLNEKAEGRMIGGSVSRSDVTLHVVVDGTPLNTTPVIAGTPSDDGSSTWTLTLPETVSDGNRQIEVWASVIDTEEVSELASGLLAIATPLKVADPPVDTSIPTVVVITDYAQEMGQFVAPTLPTVSQTQLFGVATTDLTEGGSMASGAARAPQRANATLLGSDIQSAAGRDAAPIVATESGWVFLGVEWYWWAVSGALLVAAFTLGIHVLRQQLQSNFVGAESL